MSDAFNMNYNQSVILKFMEANGPSTAREVAEGIARKRKQDITSRSVVNNIRILTAHGFIRITDTSGSSTVYEIVPMEGDH